MRQEMPVSITMPAPESLIVIEPQIGWIARLDNLADVSDFDILCVIAQGHITPFQFSRRQSGSSSIAVRMELNMRSLSDSAVITQPYRKGPGKGAGDLLAAAEYVHADGPWRRGCVSWARADGEPQRLDRRLPWQ